MAILLALVTAAVFGIGDFWGGMAAKRARVLQVVAGSHFVGAVGATVAALLVAQRFDVGDVALGAAGGAFGVLGVGLLYRRLAVGPMSVVAPLTAIASAVVPTAWGILGGERLSWVAWIGVGFGLAAVVLVSLVSEGRGSGRPGPGGPPSSPGVGSRVVLESLLAGVGFGSMFIFLDATDAASAPWPVAGARILTTSTLVLVLICGARRGGRPVMPADRGSWWLIAVVGVLDTGSNITFLYASNLGELAVVSVLSALYPISTVILARVILGERMTRLQGLGLVSAIVATELLVLG